MGNKVELTSGTIQTVTIAEARQTMKDILEKFIVSKGKVADLRGKLAEDWVGQGRNEFETQYTLLISKVSDIGDTLGEMYQALVDAEAAYGETDDGFHQDVIMSMQESGLDVSGADTSAVLSEGR